MLIHFIHGYYCIYRPWQHIYTLRTTVYHSFTSALLRYARYARVYWLAEFGDVSCLQFNYLRVETLTPTWEDFVGQFGRTFVGQFGRTIWSDICRTILRVKSDKTLCPTWVFDHWYTWRDLYMKLVTKYQISAINSCWEKCDEKWAYMFNVYKHQQNRQTGSRNLMGQKRFPRYGVPIWSLWPNIRFLPSIAAEKNVTKNEHICSMCIKTN